MTITPSLFEAFLKCPMKCWLRAINEQPAGNIYAEWVKAQNESYRVAETNRLIAQMPPPGSALSPPAETLKPAKWLLASDVVVRATGMPRGSRSEGAPSSPSQPGQPGIDAGSGSLGNRTPVPSSALGTPDSTLETSPAHLGAAPQPAESPPTCVLETCLHLVERVPAEGRGKAAQFIPIRCIFFNKLTKDDKLLLAYDAFVLGQVLGRDIAAGKLLHGDEHATLKVKTSALAGEVRKRLEKIAALLSSSTPPDLVLNRHCGECEFRDGCRQKAIEKDDLSLLAGMSAKERQKLRSKGIFTVTQLSYTFRPRRRPKKLRDKREKHHHSLKALAIREKKIHIVGSPELKIEGTPVYRDVEGLPDRDFYYLIGLRIGHGESAVQYSLWADTVEDEGRIWHRFLAILTTIEKPVLIHYGSYETTFLKRMCELYGETFESAGAAKTAWPSVNVLSFVFARIYFPGFSNGLKDTASSLGYRWTQAGPSGLDAIVWRCQWEDTREPALKERLTTYNLQDCEALSLVVRLASDLSPGAEDGSGTGVPGVVRADADDFAKRGRWRTFTSSIDGFEGMNATAPWDYHRHRVYARSIKGPKKAVPPASKNFKPKRIQQVVVWPSSPICPRCGQTGRWGHARTSRTVNDIIFGRHSLKRRLVQYQFRVYRCRKCEINFGVDNRFQLFRRYGWNLVVYLLYQVIELDIPQLTVLHGFTKFFGSELSRNALNHMKTLVGSYYAQTNEKILERLLRGNLVHADETRANIHGKTGFVWVLTSHNEVVYTLADSREKEIAQRLLVGFKGVLVSDFYTAYDTIGCPQQRCLIHLMRDLNDEVLSNPFDAELKHLVALFAALLRPIVETVDRHGLKRHFLRRHLASVEGFYREIGRTECRSEAATKCKERFERNRDKLFTFLSYDEVPWHNNNAEHAIKAFARLRDVVAGASTERSLKDYLILLSICQTCKYMGLDFLDFLRSGEKDIYAFAESHRRRRRRSLDGQLQVPLVSASANQ